MIDVFVAVGEPLLRRGVEAALRDAGDCRLVGTAAMRDEVEAAAATLGSAVLILGGELQQEDGGLISALLERNPGVRILLLVSHRDEECVLRSVLSRSQPLRLSREAAERLHDCCLLALRSQARGCVPRGATESRLVDAVRAVAAGEIAAGAWMAGLWALTSGSRSSRGAAPERVSSRELEVLRLLAEGLSNKGIASRLGIREQTVKNHLSRLMRKLGGAGRVELVLLAMRYGLVRR